MQTTGVIKVHEAYFFVSHYWTFPQLKFDKYSPAGYADTLQGRLCCHDNRGIQSQGMARCHRRFAGLIGRAANETEQMTRPLCRCTGQIRDVGEVDTRNPSSSVERRPIGIRASIRDAVHNGNGRTARSTRKLLTAGRWTSQKARSWLSRICRSSLSRFLSTLNRPHTFTAHRLQRYTLLLHPISWTTIEYRHILSRLYSEHTYTW